MNCKRSQRGAIRRPWNVITWAGVIRRLKSHGVDDAASVIKRWNDMAGMAAENRMVGAKRTALLNLLNISDIALDMIIALVSEFTWEACPFTEEFLGSTKLKVGATIRTQNKEWMARFRVSNEALELFCAFLQARYRRSISSARKKMAKAELEDWLHIISMAHNMVQEITAQVPVAEEKIQKDRWGAKYICLLLLPAPSLLLPPSFLLPPPANAYAPPQSSFLCVPLPPCDHPPSHSSSSPCLSSSDSFSSCSSSMQRGQRLPAPR